MQELLLDSLVQAIAETVMAEISFPHFDAGRLAGYELKNGDFTRFATEGTEESWVSNIIIDDDCIVFGESAINALSHAVLFRKENTCYASIGGKPRRSFTCRALFQPRGAAYSRRARTCNGMVC